MCSEPKAKQQKKSRSKKNIQIEENKKSELHAIFISKPDDSGDSDTDSENEDLSTELCKIPNIPYTKVLENNEENQEILEEDFNYKWVSGEKNTTKVPITEFFRPECAYL